VPDFFDVVRAQRACRDFADDAVPDADIERMIGAATHAPSAENRQPWRFIVVSDDGARERVNELTREVWERGGREHAAKDDPHLFKEVDNAVAQGAGGAPALIVVAADMSSGVRSATVASSLFPAVQNLLLAANALGYGSALTTLTTFAGAELATILELPDTVTPIAVVPIGRPARKLGPPKRRPPVMFRDSYQKPW
jgi:nitroreductase